MLPMAQLSNVSFFIIEYLQSTMIFFVTFPNAHILLFLQTANVHIFSLQFPLILYLLMINPDNTELSFTIDNQKLMRTDFLDEMSFFAEMEGGVVVFE